MSDEAKQTSEIPHDDAAAEDTGAAAAEAVETVAPVDDAPPESTLDESSNDQTGDDEPSNVNSNDVKSNDEGEEDVAQWADDDDLQALAEEQALGGAEDADVEDIAPLEETPDTGPAESRIEERPMDWYILKVQSNREDSIAAGLQRRVKVAGLDDYFEEIVVPVEMVTEFKGGKKRVVKRKLYPGYIVVHMIINDETWFLVRETPGIGDFTGAAGRPTPMMPHEVSRIVPKDEDVETEEPRLQIGVSISDRVKIADGTFENFEGDVDAIDETNGRVTVMINIFGRSTPVELEYWQIEKL